MDTKSNMYCFSKRIVLLGVFLFAILLFIASSLLLLKNKENIQSKAASPQIVGGVGVEEGEYPAVALLYNGCSGILIHPQWVLTAGHCVDEEIKSPWSVSVGITKKDDYFAKYVNVIRHEVYPDYKDSSVGDDYDIALLQIDPPLTNVPLPKLPELETDSYMYNTKNWVTLVGWGCTSMIAKPINDSITPRPTLAFDLKYINKLQKIELPILEYSFVSGNNVFQFGYKDSLSLRYTACFGDSGGPIIFRSNNNQEYVIGIMSSGELFEGGTGISAISNIATKVINFVPWIKKTISTYSVRETDNSTPIFVPSEKRQ